MKLKTCLLAIGLAFGTSTQAGQLLQIYREALDSDPQLKAAEANYLADAEVRYQTRSALLPQVNADVSASYNYTEAGGNDDDFTNLGWGVSATQALFRAQEKHLADQGLILSNQAAQTYRSAQLGLMTRTITAYLDVLQAQTVLVSSQAQERAIKRRLDQVTAQFEVGLIAITDVQEAQATYDNARVDRILAEGDLDNSYEAIERLTGKHYEDLPTLSEQFPVQPLQPDSRDHWINKAKEGNLDLIIARFALDAARAGAKAADAGDYPAIDLFARYSDNTNSGSLQRDTTSASIGVQLNMPLYVGGRTSSEERQASYRASAAQQQLDDVFRGTQQSTRNLFRDIRTDIETIGARAAAIRSSESALEATSAGFEVGTRNVVDVLEAEQAVFAARRDYAIARYDYVRDLFEIRRVVGSLSDEDIAELDRWMNAKVTYVK